MKAQHQTKEETRRRIAARLQASRSGARELHIGPAFVPPQPAQLDRSRESGAVLIRRSARFEKRAAVHSTSPDELATLKAEPL